MSNLDAKRKDALTHILTLFKQGDLLPEDWEALETILDFMDELYGEECKRKLEHP
jgi:hypothetical protein